MPRGKSSTGRKSSSSTSSKFECPSCGRTSTRKQECCGDMMKKSSRQ